MNYLLMQILLCLLVAGLIGLLIGWLLRGGCHKKLNKNDDDWSTRFSNENNLWEGKIQSLKSEQQRSLNQSKSEILKSKEALELVKNKYLTLNSKIAQKDIELTKQKSILEKESKALKIKLFNSENKVELLKKGLSSLKNASGIEEKEDNTLHNEVVQLKRKLAVLESSAREREFNLNVELAKAKEKEKAYEEKANNYSNEIQLLKTASHNSLKKHKDNLQEIKGIGEVLEKTLNTLGVYQFEQIAQWNQKQIESINNHISFQGRVENEKWVEQAKELAKGEETNFSKPVNEGEIPTRRKE